MPNSAPVHKRRLWLIVCCLWVLWAIRAHEIMALPVFVDESLHIIRGKLVYQFSDAKASFLLAKLLFYYYLGLFDLHDVGGAWLARQSVALLAPLSAALTYRLAQMLFQRQRIGLWAILLYTLTPFLVFFERMALADAFAMTFGLALAILSLRLARQPTRWNSILTGFALGLAILAKLTTAPWIALPPAAAWLFGRWPWTQYRRHLATISFVLVLCLAPSVAYMVYREVKPNRPANRIETVEQVLFVPESNSRLEQIQENIERYSQAAVSLFSRALLVLLFGLGAWQLYRQPKPVIFLIVFALAIWASIIVIAARPSARYLVMSVPALLILIAAGIDSLLNMPRLSPLPAGLAGVALRIARPLALAGVLLLLLLWGNYSIGFVRLAWNDPVALPLARREIWEYYQQTASGYGLREAAYDLPRLEKLAGHPPGAEIPVAGFVGSCHMLPLYLPADSGVSLECPYYRWKPEFAPEIEAQWIERVNTYGAWYFLADDEDQPMDIFSLPLHWEKIAHYSRPHNGIGITLYRVTPKETS